MEREKNSAAAGDAMERIITALMRSREGADLVSRLAPAVFRAWAGENRLKKMLAEGAGRSIVKGFAAEVAPPRNSLAETAAVPAFLDDALLLTPAAMNILAEMLHALVRGFAALPAGEKRNKIEALSARLDPSIPAKTLNALAGVIHEINTADKNFFAERLRPVIGKFIDSADFGALKDAMDSSPDAVAACADALWDELWRYPAKVICLLSLLPVFAHTLMDLVRAPLKPLNRLAPDLLADVAFSLLNDLDGARLGRLVNEINELLRKIHTGSVLLGEEGKPRGPQELSRLAGDFVDAVDWGLCRRAAAMWAETLEAAEDLSMRKTADRPDIAGGMVLDRLKRAGRDYRRFGRLVKLLEGNHSDDDLARLLSSGMDEADPQELGVIISRALSLLNRARRSNPGIASAVFEQFVGSLDEDEFREALGWCVPDIVSSLKPLAPVLLPPIIRGAAELIAADDGPGGELSEAVALLRAAILNGEGRG